MNKILIASAGSGKTTYIINEALTKSETVLITTFTQENEKEIRRKIYGIKGFIPENITIMTWFSFLMKHGMRPYQGILFKEDIKGLILVSKNSSLYIASNGKTYQHGEENVKKHYFTNDNKIYSDKLSKFVIKSNELNDNKVIERISKIFSYIYVDEVQDMAGYDLELFKLLVDSNSNIFLAGDPRQVTYKTHYSPKNKKYSNGNIKLFIEEKINRERINIDEESLLDSWRCNLEICEFANKLFPELPNTGSNSIERTSHDGIFLVRKSDVDSYLEEYKPIQLRNNSSVNYNVNYEVKNFGESKGLTFERVLIYPTKPINDWIYSNIQFKSTESKSKFYVALTRAKYSVGIVCDDDQTAGEYNIYSPL